MRALRLRDAVEREHEGAHEEASQMFALRLHQQEFAGSEKAHQRCPRI